MAHLNYYLDLCTDAYIVEGDAVLLRLHEKYNIWIGPGGHIDPGEDPNEAALREILEETGLRVELVGPKDWTQTHETSNTDLVPPLFVSRHMVSDTHTHSVFIFAAKTKTRTINPQSEADKGAEFVWVTQEELDRMFKEDKRLRPETHRYASKALELVSKK